MVGTIDEVRSFHLRRFPTIRRMITSMIDAILFVEDVAPAMLIFAATALQ